MTIKVKLRDFKEANTIEGLKVQEKPHRNLIEILKYSSKIFTDPNMEKKKKSKGLHLHY
jgi:hypothetical protein